MHTERTGSGRRRIGRAAVARLGDEPPDPGPGCDLPGAGALGLATGQERRTGGREVARIILDERPNGRPSSHLHSGGVFFDKGQTAAMPGVAMEMCALIGRGRAATLPLVGVSRTGETRGSPRKSDRRSGVGVASSKITPTRRPRTCLRQVRGRRPPHKGEVRPAPMPRASDVGEAKCGKSQARGRCVAQRASRMPARRNEMPAVPTRKKRSHVLAAIDRGFRRR